MLEQLKSAKNFYQYLYCAQFLTRLCKLENVISYFDLFDDISGPILCPRLVMKKNGPIFPMCSSMTLRKDFELDQANKKINIE